MIFVIFLCFDQTFGQIFGQTHLVTITFLMKFDQIFGQFVTTITQIWSNLAKTFGQIW